MPLARQGDKTKCDVSGSPAPAIPKAAAPQYWGGTLAKNAGEDGMMHGEHFDARVLGAYASLEDKTSTVILIPLQLVLRWRILQLGI